MRGWERGASLVGPWFVCCSTFFKVAPPTGVKPNTFADGKNAGTDAAAHRRRWTSAAVVLPSDGPTVRNLAQINRVSQPRCPTPLQMQHLYIIRYANMFSFRVRTRSGEILLVLVLPFPHPATMKTIAKARSNDEPGASLAIRKPSTPLVFAGSQAVQKACPVPS